MTRIPQADFEKECRAIYAMILANSLTKYPPEDAIKDAEKAMKIYEEAFEHLVIAPFASLIINNDEIVSAIFKDSKIVDATFGIKSDYVKVDQKRRKLTYPDNDIIAVIDILVKRKKDYRYFENTLIFWKNGTCSMQNRCFSETTKSKYG